MRLTIVGCSGSYPGPDSTASCYLLEAEHEGRTWRVLLDLGNGALGQLHRYADPLEIDAVLVSHLHADHCLDLCGYYVMRKYHPTGPQPRIPVWGPAGTADRMARAYDLPLVPGMNEEFDFHDWSSGSSDAPVRLGPVSVEARQGVHPVTAYALRGSAGGRTLVSSGDTGPCDALDDAGGMRTWRILLDLGNGALGHLHRHADPLAVDAVFVSHLHADHCLDLCGYYVLRKYHPAGPQPRLPVWGPAGTAERMARAYDLPTVPGMTQEFDFRVHDPERVVELGPFRVAARPVVHPVEAFALRVTAGDRALVYTGDTGPCPALDRVAEGADLLLAEASFQSGAVNPPDLHLTGADCGRTAAAAGVGRLVLTHIPPWYDPEVARAEASGQWDGPVELARAGASYDV